MVSWSKSFSTLPANLNFRNVPVTDDIPDGHGGYGRPSQVVADAAPAVPGEHGEADDVEQDLLPEVGQF